jgi:hypothetical protein
MTSCHCASLPDIYYVEEWPAAATDKRTQIQAEGWEALVICDICGTLWAVDVWDKYQNQVAVRVKDRENWKGASESQRKELLLLARGGIGDAKCMWANCGQPQVKNVAYCIDHLWATGARK